MGDEDKVTQSNNTAPDDLKQIRGIKDHFENVLKEAAIDTFVKLAAYSTAEQLQSGVKAKTGHEIPLWQIENKGKSFGSWMHQAQEFARQEKATGVAPNREEHKNPGENWKQHLLVTVNLGFDGETDQQDEPVRKVSLYREGSKYKFTRRFDELNAWVGWIAEEAEWPLPQLVNLETPTTESLAAPLTEIEPGFEKPLVTTGSTPTTTPGENGFEFDIIDVDVNRAESTSNMLLATVHFAVSGEGVETLLEQHTAYQVEVHTLNLDTGESQLSGYQRAQLEPNKFNYPAKIEFPMLNLGRYELQGIVLLFPPGKVVSFHQGYTFKIVP
jgi:hypothetical protein